MGMASVAGLLTELGYLPQQQSKPLSLNKTERVS